MLLQRSAAMMARKVRKTLRIAAPAVRSNSLDVSADRPHCEVASDKLADPITEHRQRATEQQRYVLRLAEKAAQRTAFDMPHVFGRLRADVNDALNVGNGENVMHELHWLEERRERYVVEAPH